MTNRERVLAAINHKDVDRIPRNIGFTPPALEMFKENTGMDDPAEYFNLEMRTVYFRPLEKAADFSAYYLDCMPAFPTEIGWDIGEWGVGTFPGSMYHFVHIVSPMKNMKTLDELKNYPFPNPMAIDRDDHLDEEVRAIKAMDLSAVGFMEWTIWEIAWQMRGMEQIFDDMYFNSGFAGYLFDRITEIRCSMAERFAEAGVDILRLGDDVGMQNGMMMSPIMWREWLKPRLKQVIACSKKVNPKIKISYHSDGMIYPIIPDLIEVGVDILNPIQPECMDPFQIKKEYGKDLVLFGCLGTQTTMPFGTPEEVKRTIAGLITGLGSHGGFILAPTHVIEPEVPWENIKAMFNMADEIWF